MNTNKDICPLYTGGHCPVCDDEWCDLGISYQEGQKINRDCCKAHYHPDEEELKEMFGKPE